jgi:hypothetical protein
MTESSTDLRLTQRNKLQTAAVQPPLASISRACDSERLPSQLHCDLTDMPVLNWILSDR